MSFDLNSLSFSELRSLGRDIDRAIKSARQRLLLEAREALDAKAKEFGFDSANDVLQEAGSKKTRRTSSPKYFNPKNPAETWTGQGRRPRWFQAALASGISQEDLLLAKRKD